MVRVAIIDDDPDFVVLVREVLAMRGWCSCALAGREDVVSHLRQTKPDAIMLDIRLSRRISAWDLLDRIIADPVLCTTPVVVCSAASSELRERAEWLADRGAAQLEKPFDIDELYLCVDAAIRSAQAS